DSEGWYGWYYDDIVVDTSDGIPDGIHLNMSMDFWDCDAYFFTRLYNTTDGQWDEIYDRSRDLQGPCLKPFVLQLDGADLDNDQGDTNLSLGD
ncbi:MAG: hypothetical protein QF834_07115, partial [Candidatus Thalassarchaeaceae archaeon]|nr:hypothetical protein [Candidatus Thalassarchaeaceae archaeon]